MITMNVFLILCSSLHSLHSKDIHSYLHIAREKAKQSTGYKEGNQTLIRSNFCNQQQVASGNVYTIECEHCACDISSH